MIDDVDAILAQHGLGELTETHSHFELTGTVSASEAYALGMKRLFDLALELMLAANKAWGPTPEAQAEAVQLYGSADVVLVQACQANFMHLVTLDCVGQA